MYEVEIQFHIRNVQTKVILLVEFDGSKIIICIDLEKAQTF